MTMSKTEVLAVMAHSHIAMAESLQRRLDTRHSAMSSDVREILQAIKFAHMNAATQLIEEAKQ